MSEFNRENNYWTCPNCKFINLEFDEHCRGKTVIGLNEKVSCRYHVKYGILGPRAEILIDLKWTCPICKFKNLEFIDFCCGKTITGLNEEVSCRYHVKYGKY